MKTYPMIIAGGLFCLTALSATSATASDKTSSTMVSGQCQSFKNQIIEQVVNQAINERYPHYYHYRYGRGMMLESAKAAPSTTAAVGGPSNYTKTNNQEQGVDEADRVKTDGKYIYSIHNREVVILKSWPMSKTNVVARYKMPSNIYPSQLLLRKDQLLVLSYGQFEQPQPKKIKAGASARRIGRPYYAYRQGTHMHLLDISNRKAPKLVKQHVIEGHMKKSRMIGSNVYLVSGSQLSSPKSLLEIARKYKKGMPSNGLTIGQRYFNRPIDYKAMQSRRLVARKVLLAHMKQVGVSAKQLADAMPKARSGKTTSSMYSCAQLHVPNHGTQAGLLNVTHLDLKKPSTLNHAGIVGSGWNIYTSQQSLYVSMSQYGYNYWRFGQPTTKTQPNTSVIHKFTLNGKNNRPEYAASGIVQGHLLNQFSMSEHQGHLRVATTDQNWWNRGRNVPGAKQPANANNIQVLRESGTNLKVVGEVKGLAPGERIYSARMVGDKAYVVTFRQTDPLYVIDLKNPEKPTVKGELKINGFSSYIHPLGPNHLLTIGQDADDNGRTKGAHLQIFDVSNPAKPIRTHHKIMTTQRSWSSAQYDHHAFTYDPVTKMLAVPLSFYNRNTRTSFNGLAVYHISKRSGIEEIGRVDHTAMAASKHEKQCAKTPNAWGCNRHNYNRYTWSARMQRSIIIDGHLFSMSQLGWTVHQLKSLKSPLATVML